MIAEIRIVRPSGRCPLKPRKWIDALAVFCAMNTTSKIRNTAAVSVLPTHR